MKRFALFIALGLLSINVLATTPVGLVQSISKSDTFATELFGDESITVQGNATVILDIVHERIDKGNIADITFELGQGATFASGVSLTDFTAINQPTLSWSIKKGGAIGDYSVTLTVTTNALTLAGNGLKFKVPKLGNLRVLEKAGGTIELIVTVEVVGISGAFPWPNSVQNISSIIAESRPALFTSISNPETASITLDNRTILFNGPDLDHDNDANTPPLGSLLIGDVAIGLAGVTTDSDGSRFELGKPSQGALVTFTTTGDFNPGDSVCIELTAKSGCTALPIVDNKAIFTTDITTLNSGVHVNYVPSGGGTLSPGLYSTVVTIAYDVATNNSGLYDPIISTGTTQYRGMLNDGSALAIPSSKSPDNIFIRITNQKNAKSFLFGIAYTQSGEDLGLREITTLEPYETRVFSQTDIENIFGTWTGRARVEFLTDGDITVQTMARSGGVLNNITGSTGTGTQN